MTTLKISSHVDWIETETKPHDFTWLENKSILRGFVERKGGEGKLSHRENVGLQQKTA